MDRASILAALLSCIAALAVGRVEAEAWTPSRGEGAVSISYQNFDATGQFESNGDRIAIGGSQSQTLRRDLDYALNGGLNFPADGIDPDRHDLFVEHDRFLDDDRIKAGFGGRVTLPSAMDLFGFYGSGFGVGVAWLFGVRQ